MPAVLKGYATPINQLAALSKKLERDTDRPEVWRKATLQATTALMRLLLAADHDPSVESAAEERKK